ncbi:MAG: 1,4-alpha-glucan branching protein GlgB [Acidobacteriota bacterium]
MSRRRSPAAEVTAVLAGRSDRPHDVLGMHAEADGSGFTARALFPGAVEAELRFPDRDPIVLTPLGQTGLFEAQVEGPVPTEPGEQCFVLGDGRRHVRLDPYAFAPSVGDFDRHLFNRGEHRRPWAHLGANPTTLGGHDGVSFAVWAPAAVAVSLVGSFGGWDPRLLPMRRLGRSGIFELFVPGIASGESYKFSILDRRGQRRYKADPFARRAEGAPAHGSRVHRSRHEWTDQEWMERRPHRNQRREPMLTYEVHLASWKRPWDERSHHEWDEITEQLVPHLLEYGFTHVELMPLMEHPFEGSWGYQVSGYHAPSARFGDPDGFKRFVDRCHREGIGVILDWVPGHFVKDDFGLREFDGTHLYEHADPRKGEHPDWKTAIFNLSRAEVVSFLLGNALFWLEEYHVDGLRVDAVASMLYLDYSRNDGEWVPNKHGGRENLESIEFFKRLHPMVAAEAPGCFTIAEESTAWPGVTAPVGKGGLGFDFKWNMGWMHDTLEYFSTDSFFRKHSHDKLSFAMLYEHTETFVNPLSHDEFVHGKRSLLGKMPGDSWQAFANYRLLLAYLYTRPGKKLLFMGTELAPPWEWNHDGQLPWQLLSKRPHGGVAELMRRLGAMHPENACLWAGDPDPSGFRWLVVDDRMRSVFAYLRSWEGEILVVVLNLTPVPHESYPLRVPHAGDYELLLDTDDEAFGGSGWLASRELSWTAEVEEETERAILGVSLPPLAALILRPRGESPTSTDDPS